MARCRFGNLPAFQWKCAATPAQRRFGVSAVFFAVMLFSMHKPRASKRKIKSAEGASEGLPKTFRADSVLFGWLPLSFFWSVGLWQSTRRAHWLASFLAFPLAIPLHGGFGRLSSSALTWLPPWCRSETHRAHLNHLYGMPLQLLCTCTWFVPSVHVVTCNRCLLWLVAPDAQPSDLIIIGMGI